MANAALWAATEPRCALEAFNVTNGDYFRWKNLWPRIAAVFDMAAGDTQTISLAQHMAGQGRAVARHDGEVSASSRSPTPSWSAGRSRTTCSACDWDVMTDVTKLAPLRLPRVVDSEEMFVRMLTRFREERIVP